MEATQTTAGRGRIRRMLESVYPDRRSLGRDLLLMNLAAIVVWAFWGVRFSLFAKIASWLHASYDSASFIAFSDWIYGHSAATLATLQRTLFYPLLLGVRFIAGDAGVFLLQCALLIAAVNLLALAVREWTARRAAVRAAFLVMALYPTFFLMTFYALPETSTVFLLTLWLYLSSRLRKGGRLAPGRAFALIFLAGILALDKPVFLPFFALFALVMLAADFKPRRLLLILLACLPLACQVGINFRLHRRAIFTDNGARAMNNYFLPKLLAQVRYDEAHRGEGGSPHFDHAQKELLGREIFSWTDGAKRAFLVRHWPQAAKVVLGNIFRENLTQGVSLVPIRSFYYGTKLFNLASLALHFYMLPLIFLVFAKRYGSRMDRAWLLLNLLLFILLVSASGTVYWQGDRYVHLLIPLWITVYAASLTLLAGKIRLTE